MILIEYEGNGYSGYSMSRNAVSAYEDGEKPKSKWTRQEILETIADINPELLPLLNKVPVTTLKDIFLYKSSWHHTSSYYNKTDFYSIDEDKIEELTVEELSNILSKYVKQDDIKSNIKKGKIDYLTWSGTRNHPKATEHTLDNVNIEERGSFYIVTDDNGNELVRKKIGSNGTYVKYYD